MPGLALVNSIWTAGKLHFRKRSDNSLVFGIGPDGISYGLTRVDLDAQSGSLLAATLASGLLVHTSVTGVGTITIDTAANLDSNFPDWQIGETMECHYLNDGVFTITLTGASGVTAIAAQTFLTLKGATIVILKTAASTYIMWAE